MIKEYYEAVCTGTEVRANLIALKTAITEEKNRRALAYLLGGDFSVLCSLLHHEDPKVRKNAALILGKMESEDLLPVLFDAYEKEETRFVKADYLRAISEMDYSVLLGQLNSRLKELRSREVMAEEQKHVAEEIRVLQAMVLKYQKPKRHTFTGYDREEEMILVTNREQREATARQIETGRVAFLRGGIRIRQARIGDILPIRTYSELLFPLQADPLPVNDPAGCGRALAESGMGALMGRLHRGEPPYCFRVELKGKLDREKKGEWIRKISGELEKTSGGAWINSTSDYEVEIRLLERKDGNYAAMLKLYTIPEQRFAYRQAVTPAAIAPVNAALVAELARPWLKEDAQILDPFCGVGTMLIERAKAVKTHTMYGVDTSGEAIEGARRNTQLADCRVFYINRDFFDFTHEYLFDEIFTDLPQISGQKSKEELRELYGAFLDKAPQHLKPEGILVLYSTEAELLFSAISRRLQYKIEERFLLNEKNGTEMFLLRLK